MTLDKIQKQIDRYNIAIGVALFSEANDIPVFTVELVGDEIKLIIFYNPFFWSEEEIEHEVTEFLLKDDDRVEFHFEVEEFIIYNPILRHLLFEEKNESYIELSGTEIEVERFMEKTE